MKLKYRLDRWGRAVLFQVIEMDESFRAKDGGLNKVITTALDVKSDEAPDLESGCIFLRGSARKYDDQICIIKFHTTAEAVEYVEQVHCSLAQWADKWFDCALNQSGNTFTID